jgi:hypothetical protein
MAKGALIPVGTVSPPVYMLALFLSFTCAASFIDVTSSILQQATGTGNSKLWRRNHALYPKSLGCGDQCYAVTGGRIAQAPGDIVRPCPKTRAQREIADVLTDAGRHDGDYVVIGIRN